MAAKKHLETKQARIEAHNLDMKIRQRALNALARMYPLTFKALKEEETNQL